VNWWRGFFRIVLVVSLSFSFFLSFLSIPGENFSTEMVDEDAANQLIEQYKQAFPADGDYLSQEVQQHGALYVGQTLSRLGSPELVQEYNQRVRMGLNEPNQVLKDLAQGWQLEQAMETRSYLTRLHLSLFHWLSRWGFSDAVVNVLGGLGVFFVPLMCGGFFYLFVRAVVAFVKVVVTFVWSGFQENKEL